MSISLLDKAPIIAMTNHKGGVGKTTTTVNLASEFAHLGFAVLVVDLDPQSNTSKHIGLKHPAEAEITVKNLLLKECTNPTKAIQLETRIEGVALLPSTIDLVIDEDKIRDRSPARPLEALAHILEPLRTAFDIILIDTPPRPGPLTGNALGCATDYLVPLESGCAYGLDGIAHLNSLVDEVRGVNPELSCLGALLCQHDERLKVCKVNKSLAPNILGGIVPITIPSSTKVTQANVANKTLRKMDRTSTVTRAYRALAMWIANEKGMANYELNEIEQAIAGDE